MPVYVFDQNASLPVTCLTEDCKKIKSKSKQNQLIELSPKYYHLDWNFDLLVP